MKYGVKILNMLKGMYEIAIFDKRAVAERAFDVIAATQKALEDGTEALSEAQYSEPIAGVLDDAESYIDYWEARGLGIKGDTEVIKDVCYSVNDNGRVSTTQANIRFVRDGARVEVPA